MRSLFILTLCSLPLFTHAQLIGTFAIAQLGTIYMDGIPLLAQPDNTNTNTNFVLKRVNSANVTAGSTLAVETVQSASGSSGFAATWTWNGITHHTTSSEWICSSWFRPDWMKPQTDVYYMKPSVSMGVSGSNPSTAWRSSYHSPELDPQSEWLWYESSATYTTTTTPLRTSYCRYTFGATPEGPAGTIVPASTLPQPTTKTRTSFVGCYSNATVFTGDRVYLGDEQIAVANWKGITTSYAPPFYRYVASIQALTLGAGFTYYFNTAPSIQPDLTNNECQHICEDDQTKYCGCTTEQGDVNQCGATRAYAVYQLFSDADALPTTDYIDNTLAITLGVRTSASIVLNNHEISPFPVISGFIPALTGVDTHHITTQATYNDVLALTVQSSGGPVGFVATWIWHGQNWMTVASEWKCSSVQPSDETWKLRSFTDPSSQFTSVISLGVSGTNTTTSWMSNSYAGEIGIASNAQWLWLEDSSNFGASKTSFAYCRYVFPSTSTRPTTSLIPTLIPTTVISIPTLSPLGSSTAGAVVGGDTGVKILSSDAHTTYHIHQIGAIITFCVSMCALAL